MCKQETEENNSPHPDKMNMDIAATERLLERFRQYNILGLLLGLFRRHGLTDDTGGSCQA